jgi:hypothetical protein
LDEARSYEGGLLVRVLQEVSIGTSPIPFIPPGQEILRVEKATYYVGRNTTSIYAEVYYVGLPNPRRYILYKGDFPYTTTTKQGSIPITTGTNVTTRDVEQASVFIPKPQEASVQLAWERITSADAIAREGGKTLAEGGRHIIPADRLASYLHFPVTYDGERVTNSRYSIGNVTGNVYVRIWIPGKSPLFIMKNTASQKLVTLDTIDALPSSTVDNRGSDTAMTYGSSAGSMPAY